MGNGGVRDSLRIQILDATTSTSPVGILGLTVASVRLATVPSTAITYSARTSSARLDGGLDVFVKDGLAVAGAVAEIDEDDRAMVAAAVAPAHQNHGLTRVGSAQFAAHMGAAKVAQKIQHNGGFHID